MRVRPWVIGAGVVLLGGGGGLYRARHAFERRWVAYRLPAIQAQARSTLTAALTHPDKFIRIDGAGLLARLGDPQGLAIFERSLNSPSMAARHGVVWRLAPFGERAIPLLEAGLRDEASIVRERAVLTLGELGIPAARDRLHQLWATAPHMASLPLLKALWASDLSGTVDLLCGELWAPARLKRAQTFAELRGHRRPIYDHLGRAARDAFDLQLDAMLRALEARGGPAGADATEYRARLALAITNSPGGDRVHDLPFGERRAAWEAEHLQRLAKMHPRVHDAARLAALLSHPDPDRRLHAAGTMEQAPTAAALAVADAQLATERVPRVRKALIRILARRAPARVIPHLVQDVGGAVIDLRNDAVDAIRANHIPELVPVFAAALDSPHPYVRIAGVRALADVAHPDRHRLLYRALRDTNAAIQIEAAAGLLMPW